jgi:hypothetical protein
MTSVGVFDLLTSHSKKVDRNSDKGIMPYYQNGMTISKKLKAATHKV